VDDNHNIDAEYYGGIADIDDQDRTATETAGDADPDNEDDGDGNSGDDDGDDDEIDEQMAQDILADDAFNCRESARALPGLLAALCDAPFSVLAQDAVLESAKDAVRVLDEQKGSPHRLPPSPEDRITALVRAQGVLAYLLAREVRAAQPLLSDKFSDPDRRANNERWAATHNLGRWREAWGDDPASSHSGEVAARLFAMAGAEHDWIINRCAGPADSPRELAAQMGLSAADREDRAMTLLATAGLNTYNPNTLAATCVGLLATLNAPPDEVQRATDHAFNVGQAALPHLLAIAPAAMSIRQGQPLTANPDTAMFVGHLIAQFASLMSTVLGPWDAPPPTPAEAEGADPAHNDDSARPAAAA
jgi:hypothetical protein